MRFHQRRITQRATNQACWDSWPVDGELVAPVEVLPEKMFQSMSENWRNQQIYKKHISELTAEAE